jgi:hypothetical protein
MTRAHGCRPEPTRGPRATRAELLARTVVELINGENDRFHAGEFLDSVARRSVSVVGGAAAGVMLNEPPANIRPAAASNLQIRRLQALEVRSQEGPLGGGHPQPRTGQCPD